MSITNGYATLAELKGRLGIASSDGADDSKLENIIEGVSRWIDRDRRRRFYSASETRYYTPVMADRVWVDDLTGVTTLSVATTTARSYTDWTTANYDLYPANAALELAPYTCIWVAPSSATYFVPGLYKSVKLVATFGYWTSTPEPINEATLLLSERIWRRKDTPFGVGGPDLLSQAIQTAVDVDVQMLLNSVPKRVWR